MRTYMPSRSSPDPNEQGRRREKRGWFLCIGFAGYLGGYSYTGRNYGEKVLTARCCTAPLAAAAAVAVVCVVFHNRACLQQNPQQNPQQQRNNTGPYGGGSKPNTGPYGGADVKPKMPAHNPYGAQQPRQANNPYGAPRQQASNPYSGAVCFFWGGAGGYYDELRTVFVVDFVSFNPAASDSLYGVIHAFRVGSTVVHQVAAAGRHGAARATPTPTEAGGARTAARCRGRARTACTFPSRRSTPTRTGGQSRPGEIEKDKSSRSVEACQNTLGSCSTAIPVEFFFLWPGSITLRPFLGGVHAYANA